MVGAGATNQAMKAVAIARALLRDDDIDLVCAPEFMDIEIGGLLRTALRLVVAGREQRDAQGAPSE